MAYSSVDVVSANVGGSGNNATTYSRRTLRVIDPAGDGGSTEHETRVHANLCPSKMRALTHRMSQRLVAGDGVCTFQVGVDEYGCHSLHDYRAMSESAWVLEGIAGGLNCIVVSRHMIQNEILEVEEWEDCGGDVGNGNPRHRLTNDPTGAIVVEEPSVLGGCGRSGGGDSMGGKSKLNTEEGTYTRCVLVIQRVETHALDPSSLSSTHANIGGEVGGGGAVGGDDVPTTGSTRSMILGCAGDTDAAGDGEMTVDGLPATVASPSVSVEETLSSRNVRIAVLGNVDAGKSTLIGTLTTSHLDDGRGSTRTLIMKHRHEIETGRTSTSSSHLLGFDRSGAAIAGCDKRRPNRLRGEDDIARDSYRVVTLMDLAGHEKYLKTTIHGITSGMADYGLILVNSRHPPTHMTQHHLNLCCGYGIPVVVVFTKVDGCPDHALEASKKELSKLLRSPNIGRRPFAIKTEADVLTCIGKLHTLAPTLDISCVTGEGLDLLRKILFALPKRRKHEKKANRPFEFLVEDVFSNVPGVGSVVSGFVNAGELHVGTAQVFVGPTDDGTFLRTTARSAQISRINTSHITSGQSATIALSLGKEMRKKLRRGMVVVVNNPTSTREFDAEICVLKGEGTTIRESYQAHVHTLNVRQTAYARNIEIINTNALGLTPTHCTKEDTDGIVLRPGSRAKVRFEFANRPEYIRPGMRMLFRDGRVRGVGIITGIPDMAVVLFDACLNEGFGGNKGRSVTLDFLSSQPYNTCGSLYARRS